MTRRLLILMLAVALFGLKGRSTVFKDFIHTYTNTSSVGTVLVDENGTAWVGTSVGLMHYDDLRHGESVRRAMPEELRVPIHLIYGLNDGRMAVVTQNMRKFIFNPEDYRITEIDESWLHDVGIDAPGGWTVNLISEYGNVALVETEGHIYRFDPGSGKKAELIKDVDSPTYAFSADNRYYHIATPTCIYSYELSTGKFTETPNPDELFAPHVIRDNKGNLWLGDRHLYRYIPEEGKWTRLKENVFVSEIAKSDNDIYIGTSSSGILHYNDGGVPVNQLRNDPFDINSPVSDHCAMIYVDKSDNLWVTYSKCDLSISSPYYNFTKVRHISPLRRQMIKDDIISILPLDIHTLLVGTDGHGMYAVDVQSGERTQASALRIPEIKDEVITSFFLDSRRRLWIGSYRTGLICVAEGTTRRFLPTTSPYSIVEDIDGNIYAGTSGNGLYRIDAELREEPRKINLGNEIWIQKLVCERSGTVLVATASKLMMLDTRSFDHTEIAPVGPTGESLTSGILNSIYLDSRSLLWTVGADIPHCLKIYDLQNDSVYSIETLSGVRFKSVVEDDSKNMWLSSDNDIYNIVPHYDPVSRSYSFRHFVYHVRSNEPTPNNFNCRSVARMSDGRLVFGGTNGYQIVDPVRYQQLGKMAQVKGCLSLLKVNNQFVIPNSLAEGEPIMEKSLEYNDKVTLRSNLNNVSLLFSPRDYDSPFKTEYYYRLESTGNEWYPISGNAIELRNLSPGRHHLEVSAMLPEGVLSGTIDGIDIEVLYPWYQTTWAYILYAVLVVLILLAIGYYFMDRQKQKLRVAQAEKEIARQHQLNEMKLRFFTNISHDFRTPLSLIITPLESFLNTHDDADTVHFLKPVHKNAVRLLNLVNQILDFRKLDVTGVPLHLSYGDLVNFVKEICTSFTLFSEDTEIDLDVKSEEDALYMYFDKDKLTKIMMNLLSNAFKYTDKGGRVSVIISRKDNRAVIAVADTGRGIPDGDKERVFDRFYQTDDLQRATMGCGIGLHIVKEFVEMHEGTVSVSDNTPKGTVFTVSIPLSPAVENGREENLEKAGQRVDSLELPAVGTRHQDGRPTVLLVEDNQDFIDFMEQSLKGEYNILKACNGKHALSLLGDENIDIIISDVMMDEIDGLELCNRVKSDLKTSHIPFILLTARSLAEDEMRGLESGADDYVTKPFNMQILQQRIAKLIDENRRSHDKFRRIPDIAPSEITITPLDEQFLTDTIRIVEENMSNPDFSVEMLSSRLGMHRTHLYKKLSGITGKTPIEFIRLMRLKRAAQYLAHSQMYISEIAYKVGFNNPRLLSKYFKEEYNMTPREYIRSLGIDTEPTEDDAGSSE